MRARWLVCLATAGCATRAAPYRFASPLVSGVTALIDGPSPVEPAPEPAADRAPAARPVSRRTAPIARGEVVVDRRAAPDPMPREEPVARPIALALPGVPAGLALDRLAAPHRAAAAGVVLPARPTAADLRELAGTRSTDDPLAFAVRTAAALTGAGHLPDPVPADGAGLAAWADTDATAVAPDATAAGDLVAFDRAIGDHPASLWAVVIAVRGDGVRELVFVGGGVVRRGFVDPAAPRVARDARGVVHNTFLRFGKGWPPEGTRYLAGELLGRAVRLR